MRTLLGSFLALLLAYSAPAATTRNDAGCDVAVMPAATLLLPWFEVDLDTPGGETTLVTITNVTNTDTVARVTLWTDRGYPVLTFNVLLTGYDAQSLNLYDILANGVIARTAPDDRGPFSIPNPAIGTCELTSDLSDAELARIQSAFTTGSIEGECESAGSAHENAAGYATIDVVGNCSANTPRDRAYWSADLRYDNILLGDYEQVLSNESLAQGGPLVHIRAIPEGGTPRSRRDSDDAGFPRTFYSRFQPSNAPRRDGRQPLPAQFAARWTQGTSLKIWREGRAGIDATCDDFAAEENLAVADVVTFDEQENGVALDGRLELVAATNTDARDPVFPQLVNGASNGWIYLNLDRSSRDDFASQAWVVSSTRVEDRYSSDVDAIPLGNGCSAPVERGEPIAPASNDTNDDSCDVAALPAATLLLPYFEVDPDNPQGEKTIFTVTNVSPEDRIARVTLWTDYAYPVLTFNIYLTGYDVQSIDLYDVIVRGLIAPDSGLGTQVSQRGPFSDRNFTIDLSECGVLPGPLPPHYVSYMQLAFTEGRVPAFEGRSECHDVGGEHDNAVGYATIDVVRNCRETNPLAEEYWTEDLAWDNVLIGDVHQVHLSNNYAQGSTLVHIRAIPEGGTAEQRLAVQRTWDAGFPRTFYSRFQPPNAPKLDGRQPLPSVFAARWIEGGPASFQTFFKVWREGKSDGSCATNNDNLFSWVETVRFDENENAWADVPQRPTIPVPEFTALPATARLWVDDSSLIPPTGNGALAGWIYFNFDDSPADGTALQNWVVSSLLAEGRYSVDIDAAALGNGCSAETAASETTIGTDPIAPRP